MERISITRNGEVLAHHTTDSPLSHFGQPVWVVEQEEVDPGKVQWCQGSQELTLNALARSAVGWWSDNPTVFWPVLSGLTAATTRTISSIARPDFLRRRRL